MAKKLQVDVNAGDIIDSFRPDLPPVFASGKPEPPVGETNESDEMEEPVPRQGKKPALRAHKEITERENEYLELFIRDAEMAVRTGKLVYVRKDFHDRLLRIIQVIGKNELSLSGYIDHVLSHHFTQYEEEIKKLYKKYYEEVY